MRRSGRRDARDHLAVLLHVSRREAFLDQGAGRASLDTFAAAGAVSSMTPIIRHVAHQAGRDASC